MPALEDGCAEARARGTAQPTPSQQGPWPGPTLPRRDLRAAPSSVLVPRQGVPMVRLPGEGRRAPCSPLPPHVAGTGAGKEFWLQDLLAALSAYLDPSIQIHTDARPECV